MSPSRTVPQAAAAGSGAASSVPGDGSQAFSYAFRFASAIASDPKDRSRAQESVVLDLARIGVFDEAALHAREVGGWRRGTAAAGLAIELARAGKREEARRLIAEASKLQPSIQGWQSSRVASEIDRARASLGELGQQSTRASEVAEFDPDLAGRMTWAHAVNDAAKGHFPGAMSTLGGLGGEKDYDATLWRTTAYLEVARLPGITKSQRVEALLAGRRSAAGIPGWKRAELLVAVADELRGADRTQDARGALQEADPILTSLPATTAVKAQLIADAASTWGRVGSPGHGRSLLLSAEKEVAATMVIDQPAAWASLARAYYDIGDRESASRLFDAALSAVERLENARPRALAAVDVCRSMGSCGMPLDDGRRARLDAILGGLKDPW